VTVAVVTGAGRGIGRAVALRLAERGCDVALLARTVEQIESAAAEVVALGRKALALRCDVANAGEVARAAEKIQAALGVPRVVVANAGVVRRSLVVDTSEEEWDHVLDVNLKGTFLLARALLPAMIRAKRGRLVAVASISATLGTARQSAYCAAKWGLVGFVKSLAEELRGHGLQAMSVLPGSVDTEMLKGGDFKAAMSPDDVAGLVTYAALDAPDAMNGSAIEMFGP
jgi:3-oxoacyl-[acyl-carrier protein] reductase